MRQEICPICGHSFLRTVLYFPDIPVFVNTHSDSASAAKASPMGTQNLVQCNYCGFIFNRAFELEKVAYDTDYHAERGCSSYYTQHVNRVIDLIETVKPIKGQYILEAACGGGEFLREAVGRGPKKAVGVDPSAPMISDGALVIQQGLFDRSYLSKMEHPVDILINRHMIEHILNPLEMLKQFNQALAPNGILYLETPRLDWILENNAFFDFPYEHCAYFSDDFIVRMLSAAGFEAIKSRNSYDGQYFSICARKCKARFPIEAADAEKLLQTQELFAALERVYSAANHAESVQGFCTETLVPDLSGTKCSASTQSGLYLWGAAAKGVMCANLLDQWPITGLIDINPYKQGTFIPGTGHRVFSPAEITFERVKMVIVENDVYLDEIYREIQKIDPRITVLSISKLIRM